MPLPQPTSSNATAWKDVRALVHAPPDNSKTFSSISMSEKCPADFSTVKPKVLKKREPKVVLDDLLWLAFDRGATAGMEQQGLEVPQFDLSGVDMKFWDDIWKDHFAAIQERVNKGITKTLVVDTVSAFDGLLNYRARAIRGLTGFDLNGDMLAGHQRFMMPLKTLKCHILYLCHSKSLMDLQGTSDAVVNQQRSRKAMGVSGIVPDLTGKALMLYRADANLVAYVLRKMEGNDRKHIFQLSAGDAETKTRFVLPAEMPADWRLIRQHLQGNFSG